MTIIYTLALAGGKYYVGRSNKPNARILSHFSEEGSEWTKLYKPERVVSQVKGDEFDEEKHTLIAMDKYGVDSVRGGSYCKVKMSVGEREKAEQTIRSIMDKCYKCGEKGHFAKECGVDKAKKNNKTGIIETQIPEVKVDIRSYDELAALDENKLDYLGDEEFERFIRLTLGQRTFPTPEEPPHTNGRSIKLTTEEKNIWFNDYKSSIVVNVEKSSVAINEYMSEHFTKDFVKNLDKRSKKYIGEKYGNVYELFTNGPSKLLNTYDEYNKWYHDEYRPNSHLRFDYHAENDTEKNKKLVELFNPYLGDIRAVVHTYKGGYNIIIVNKTDYEKYDYWKSIQEGNYFKFSKTLEFPFIHYTEPNGCIPTTILINRILVMVNYLNGFYRFTINKNWIDSNLSFKDSKAIIVYDTNDTDSITASIKEFLSQKPTFAIQPGHIEKFGYVNCMPNFTEDEQRTIMSYGIRNIDHIQNNPAVSKIDQERSAMCLNHVCQRYSIYNQEPFNGNTCIRLGTYLFCITILADGSVKFFKSLGECTDLTYSSMYIISPN